MSKLSSLTLAAALLSSLALPAMAQGTVHARPAVRHAPKHAVHKAASTTAANPGNAAAVTPSAKTN